MNMQNEIEEKGSKVLDTVAVIYEDEDLIAVNKPAPLVVHNDGKTKEPALTDWIRSNYPAIVGVGEPARYDGKEFDRPGIVHRLDRETSGVLVIAKTSESFEFLKEQFQEHFVEKVYRAFAYGTLKEKAGTIDAPIGRSARDFRMWSAGSDTRGRVRPARTSYKVLQSGRGASYMELYPKTGRTHQIRVHMKSIKHPVVCDKLYAKRRECLLGFNRQALHAYSLKVKNSAGMTIFLEAPLPQDFERATRLL